eukprot:gi/632976669/ref/XP_007904924.1/ PREDICTED: uromodulin-like 1 [Callorhinchus milii]
MKVNVTRTVTYQKSFTTYNSCGGWCPWKVCPKLVYRTLQRTTEVEVMESRVDCCQGYEQLGHHCVLLAEGYFHLLIEIKQDVREKAELDLMNHLRFLHSVVTGALYPLNASVYHIETQWDSTHKTRSRLLLGTRPPVSLTNVTKNLQKLLITVAEVCQLEAEDVNECDEVALNSCSGGARCVNTDGSHNCTCQEGFTVRQPSSRGRECTAPSPVVNLTASAVTSRGFLVTWTTDTKEERTFTVRVSASGRAVSQTQTPELEWAVSGLEPGTEYTVSVTSGACEQESAARELSVTTESAANAVPSSQRTSKNGLVSTMTVYLNTSRFPPGFPYLYVPPCSPSPVVNLTASAVTSRGFLITWTTDTREEQTFTVRVSASGREVIQTQTPELEWAASGLEPGTEYTVSVTSGACEQESAARELSVTTETFVSHLTSISSSRLSSTGFVSTMTIYLNSSRFPAGFDSACSPSLVVNLTASAVTSRGFLVTWTTDTREEQTFTVRVSASGRAVSQTQTPELEWAASGLEPGTEYTVSVTSGACEQESAATEVIVTTEITMEAVTGASGPRRSSLVSTLTIYPNTSRFPIGFPYTEEPPCSPSLVVNLTASAVTSRGFLVTWTTDTREEQTFTVRVSASGREVIQTQTPELEWAASGLEPGTEYTVSVTSGACEQESAAREVSVTTEPTPGSSTARASNAEPVSTMTVYLNKFGFQATFPYTEVPPCSPSPVVNLTASAVTSRGFLVTWTTDTREERTFTVRVSASGRAVSQTQTPELEWAVSGLEPGTEYTVSVTSGACEQESAARELSVTTEPSAPPSLPGTKTSASEPAAAKLVVGSVTVTCKAHEISVSVPRWWLEEMDIPESSLYLGEPPCNHSVANLTHVALRVEWTDCATRLSDVSSFVSNRILTLLSIGGFIPVSRPAILQNGTHTVVRTTLHNAPSSDASSAGGDLQVPVMCMFDNNLLSANDNQKRMNVMDVHGWGNYVTHVQIFSGNRPLANDSILTSNKELVVHLSTEASDSRARLVLAECWTSPANDSVNEVTHALIRNRCPVPETQTMVLENGNSTSARFSLKMFSVVQMPFCYLHCKAQICLETNNATCKPPIESFYQSLLIVFNITT